MVRGCGHGGQEEGQTHDERQMLERRCELDGTDARQTACNRRTVKRGFTTRSQPTISLPPGALAISTPCVPCTTIYTCTPTCIHTWSRFPLTSSINSTSMSLVRAYAKSCSSRGIPGRCGTLRASRQVATTCSCPIAAHGFNLHSILTRTCQCHGNLRTVYSINWAWRSLPPALPKRAIYFIGT